MGAGFEPVHWMVSSLTEQTTGLIAIPEIPNALGVPGFVYGGTPTDPSVVRCVRDLRTRGFKVVFYPFLLGTSSGFPWRGRITSPNDLSQLATNDVNTFMGGATTCDFVRDATNLTVAYAGPLLDCTCRRMVLHYANLCILAGGVNLFVIGSELRGLEVLRGPNWTQAGRTDGSGNAIWDYPMVAALNTLANDVRSTFDSAGYAKSLSTLENLITYSADWSSWMGWQHPGENGQWPHLDQLRANPNIDFVSFDNYLPLTDWTTAANGGLDGDEWLTAVYAGIWPPPSNELSGLGLSGPPTIYSTPYLKENIEGGQYFNWFYNDGAAGGHAAYGLDPNGSDLQVTLPAGDRLAQARNPYHVNQEISRAKAIALVVEQPSPCSLRDAIERRRLGSKWPPNAMGSAFEVDHHSRVWFRGLRQGDEPTECLLRRKVDRERDRLLVDLGPGEQSGLSPAPRRHHPGDGA